MSIEYSMWTVGVIVAVGAATLIVGWKRPFAVLSVLVLLVPFRDFTTRWLNVHSGLSISQVTDIGRWWFALIFALLGLSGGRWLIRQWRSGQRPKLELADLLLVLVVAIGLIATLLSPSLPAAVTSLRGYLQPMGVYLLARLIWPNRRQLRVLLGLCLVVGLIMAGFGLLQVTTWSEQDYRAEGYVRQNGDLVVPYAYIRGTPFLRPASTVSGPNELGMDMVLLFSIAVMWMLHRSGAERYAAAGLVLLFIGGPAATVSRSAQLGLLATAFGVAALNARRAVQRYQELEPRRKTLAWLIVLAP